ncbi:hypothetical protein ACHAXR_009389 [Thalassiosira sp. AJA248-18]
MDVNDIDVTRSSARQLTTAEMMRAEHPKRLAAILRYLASRHRGSSSSGPSFVREFIVSTEGGANESLKREFHFNDGDGGQGNGNSAEMQESAVLFSYESFRSRLPHMTDQSLFPSPPFSFYAAASESTSYSWGLGRKKNNSSGDGSCWFRLTRLRTEDPPPVPSPTVEAYLQSWSDSRRMRSYKRLIRSLDSLSHAPALDIVNNTSTRQQKEIKGYLKKCRRWAKRDAVRRQLEPLYDALFEMAQSKFEATEECILGLGNARMLLQEPGATGSATAINGPLLEVRVEIELAPDGGLLVRPCEHTGVELNREVLRALSSDREVLGRLHTAVGELETQSISPGQPGTFVTILKRIAVELSSGGRFVSTVSPSYASLNVGRTNNKLIVTDSWCFYRRPKPSQVYARDAQTLADLISKHRAGISSGSGISSPPLASLALTFGANALSGKSLVHPTTLSNRFASSIKSFLGWSNGTSQRPLFPLPSSISQFRIHSLLSEGSPAVVVEGPPGCGKTHSIANIICSYLAQGKRVLVTSKGAPALSVLRQRLPACMQELCVDATVSEASGMKQLQQTVEALADRVSRGVDRTELCESLSTQIQVVERDIAGIDAKLESFRELKSQLMQRPAGLELAELAYDVLDEAPWLAATLSSWQDTKLMEFVQSVEALSSEVKGYHDVTGYESPPSASLLAGVATQAGGFLPNLKDTTIQAVSSIPLVGSFTGARNYQERKEHEAGDIKYLGRPPTKKSEWGVVHQVLSHNQKNWELYDATIRNFIENENWPRGEVYDTSKGKLCFHETFVDTLRKARDVRCKQAKLFCQSDFDQAMEAQNLDAQRHKMVKRLQELDGKLVEARVITKLSKMFSPEAQSALIQFAQLAGKAKFKSNAQASRLTVRQQRHRQSYLKSFEKCVRYIPCWILTTNQVNDYLPTEFGLFDLCIVDEASQSDFSALPSMLRANQWLVVGDGKQVSPTENFTAETEIETLRASLPTSPFQDCFLPGHSIFDLCNQAFPIGRVVLTEHFRCSPDIIKFSNETYYQGRLQPLRLPTSSEVMHPSLVDVYLRNGRKVGKSNEQEAVKIVNMIEELVTLGRETRRQQRPKTIGVISLVGEEQSRMIRGRLLDRIGPEAYKRHEILVGEPPSFQGSERDVIFLSMVSSPGSVPTQSQLMYHQRINVALSRARDRMVLVRSINRSHIPSAEDVKCAVIDFFSEFASNDVAQDNPMQGEPEALFEYHSFNTPPMLERIIENVASTLGKSGYHVRSMGVVWEGGLCIEDKSSGARAAVAVENCGELKEEYASTISQQRAIERVGWKCYRLDAFSWLLDCNSALEVLHGFLRSVDVRPRMKPQENPSVVASNREEEAAHADGIEDDAPINVNVAAPVAEDNNEHDDGAVISSNDNEEEEGEACMQISSDEANGDDDNKEEDCSDSDDDNGNDDDNDDDGDGDNDNSEGFDPNQYGSVITLGGLANAASRGLQADDDSDDETLAMGHSIRRNARKPAGVKRKRSARGEETGLNDSDSDLDRKPKAVNVPGKRSSASSRTRASARDDDYHSDESDDDFDTERSEGLAQRKKRRKRRRRMDAHSRDPRWHPSHEPDKGDDEKMDAEQEDWEDLKDVISSNLSYRNDEDGSITSRLRASSSQNRNAEHNNDAIDIDDDNETNDDRIKSKV